MPTQRHIALITTGGTISSVSTAQGIAPRKGMVEGMLTSERMGYKLQEGSYVSGDGNAKIDVISLFDKDSTNIGFKDREVIARSVFDALKEYDGVVVTHGTDTLANTSHSLSLWLKHPLKTVVITGAFKTVEENDSDAWDNLRDSITVACEGLCGVFVVFHGRVLRGETVFEKIEGQNGSVIKTFDSMFGSVAQMQGNTPLYAKPPVVGFPVDRDTMPFLDIRHDESVIYLTLPISPEKFMKVAETFNGIVIEATASGGIPDTLLQYIEKVAKTKPVVLGRRYAPNQEGGVYVVARAAEETGVIVGSGVPKFDEAALSHILGRIKDEQQMWSAEERVRHIKGQFNYIVGEVVRMRESLLKAPALNGNSMELFKGLGRRLNRTASPAKRVMRAG
ncbi:MAG: asparaginase domain-containing protein [Candidatus Marsarchaeota archaeon]|nr:asparaginase domain-containing protein [Candidatus Marsarchaeota archaeon]